MGTLKPVVLIQYSPFNGFADAAAAKTDMAGLHDQEPSRLSRFPTEMCTPDDTGSGVAVLTEMDGNS